MSAKKKTPENEGEEEQEQEEEQQQEEVCIVRADIPPGVDNPLPPFGELPKNKNPPKKVPKKPRLYRGNDLLWICKEVKNLYRPHGLPAQIAKIPNFVTFTDGLKLREICKQVRDQHWSYICLRKNRLREKLWQLMHVERIPCGNLRESFVYSFQTYLPEKSHFPIVKDNPLPW